MTFGEYLKAFRKAYGLTQESLVEALYLFDDTFFSGLDTTTLSKWERNVTRPKTAKQAMVIKFAQEHTGLALPLFETMDAAALDEAICRSGLANLLKGKNKELVMRLPIERAKSEILEITPLHRCERQEALCELLADMRNAAHPPQTHIDAEQLRAWSDHPAHRFRVCRYKGLVTGVLFSLRLRVESYRATLLFERPLNRLDEDDFAANDEVFCQLHLAFFALDETSALRLILRAYREAIADQKRMRRSGIVAARNEAHKIVERLEMFPVETLQSEGFDVVSYDAPIETSLSSRYFVESIFTSNGCKED